MKHDQEYRPNSIVRVKNGFVASSILVLKNDLKPVSTIHNIGGGLLNAHRIVSFRTSRNFAPFAHLSDLPKHNFVQKEDTIFVAEIVGPAQG